MKTLSSSLSLSLSSNNETVNKGGTMTASNSLLSSNTCRHCGKPTEAGKAICSACASEFKSFTVRDGKVVGVKNTCKNCLSPIKADKILCPTCAKETFEPKECPVCGRVHKQSGDLCFYCYTLMEVEGYDYECKEDIESAKHNPHFLRRIRRAHFINKAYGPRYVSRPHMMETERDYSSIAFLENLYGRQMEEVLDRREIEMLLLKEEEYEIDFNDLPMYMPKAKGVTKDTIKFIQAMDEDTLELNNLNEDSEDISNRKDHRFYSREQRDTNLSFYIRKVNEAKSNKEIEAVIDTVKFGIESSIVAFEVEEDGEVKEISAPIFFPTGKTSAFFEAVVARKNLARQKAFDYAMKLLEEANTLSALGLLAKQVFKMQEARVETFTVKDENGEEKQVTASVLFPKGMSKVFWDAYRQKKADVAKQCQPVIDEYKKKIQDALVSGRVKWLKKEIYSEDISYDDKKALWELCDKRATELPSSISSEPETYIDELKKAI